MSYSIKIVFGSDGLPHIADSTGVLPPAGHEISISGHYELPRLNGEKVCGNLSINAQHFDGTGDHVISAYQHHDRTVQGPTVSDGKIVQQLINNRIAIEAAERTWKAKPGSPLPAVGPETPQDGTPVL